MGAGGRCCGERGGSGVANRRLTNCKSATYKGTSAVLRSTVVKIVDMLAFKSAKNLHS
jgi:hypothetical protein